MQKMNIVEGNEGSQDGPAGRRPTAALRTLADIAALVQLLDRQLGQCRRYGCSAALLLIEIEPRRDGTALGDALEAGLRKAVGARLAGRLRGNDLLTQCGPGLFGLVLMEAGRKEAEVVRERMRKALAEPFGLEAQRVQLELRLGLAVYREDGMSGADLSQQARLALGSQRPQRPQLSLVEPPRR